ncbi:hypothetical protein Tco_1151930 [Tanacetum coccineum]
MLPYTSDGYVPYHSARIEMCQTSSGDYSRKGKIFHEMLNNCLDQMRAPSSEQRISSCGLSQNFSANPSTKQMFPNHKVQRCKLPQVGKPEAKKEVKETKKEDKPEAASKKEFLGTYVFGMVLVAV